MIGGHDITIRTPLGSQAMELALRTAKVLWPSAVLEDAQTGETLTSLAKAGQRREVLIYRDESAAEQWRLKGADDSLTGTMIHLLHDDDGITFVIDRDPPMQIAEYVETVQWVLRPDTLVMTRRRPNQEAV